MSVHVYRHSTFNVNTQSRFTQVELPRRGSGEAVGYDLKANLGFGEDGWNKLELPPLTPVIVPTGLYFAIPPGAVLSVCSRSGLAAKGVLVVNAPGIVDPDYRGEVKVILMYLAKPDAEPFVIAHGDRIAQAVFSEVLLPHEFIEVSELNHLPAVNSTRGDGGFGSTGR